MERFTDLLSQLSDEHRRLLQDNERLLQEREKLKSGGGEDSRSHDSAVWSPGASHKKAGAGDSWHVAALKDAGHSAEEAPAHTCRRFSTLLTVPKQQAQPRANACCLSGNCLVCCPPSQEECLHFSGSEPPTSATTDFSALQKLKIQKSRSRLEVSPRPDQEECLHFCGSEPPNSAMTDVSAPHKLHQSTRSRLEVSPRPDHHRSHSRATTSMISVSTAQLKLLPFWTTEMLDESDYELVKKLVSARTTPTRSGSLINMAAVSTATTSSSRISPSSCAKALVMRPNSAARLLWDALSVLVLAYDIATVPMLVFGDGESDEPVAKQMLDLTTTLFWTMDIPASFLSGFHHVGVIEMRPSKIGWRYVKGWFMLDLPIVLLDWIVTLQQGSKFLEVVGAGRVTKVIRMIRIMRVFRLARMLKFPQWAMILRDCLRSEGLITALGVMQSLMIIAVANHFIACIWYFISGSDRPFTWVQVLDDERRDMMYRYTTALHWSVTQFTPASMEVVPRNSKERMFAIIVIFSAMVAFSCFISSITQAMAGLQRSRMERDKQQNGMRRYIAENRVSLELGHRLSTFVRTHATMAKQRLHEEDVQVFKLLPDSLHRELHREVYAPVVSRHPLFEQLRGQDDDFMKEVCHTAMSEVTKGSSEELFHPCEEALHMFFTLSGTWWYRRGRKAYKRQSDTAVSTTPEKVQDVRTMSSTASRWKAEEEEEEELGAMVLQGEKCICEVALWLQWEFQGRLVAGTQCECVSLNTGKLCKVASRSTSIHIAFREYAKVYIGWLNKVREVPEVGFSMETVEDILQDALVLMEEICVGPKFDPDRFSSERSNRGSWGLGSLRGLFSRSGSRGSATLTSHRARPPRDVFGRDLEPRPTLDGALDPRCYTV